MPEDLFSSTQGTVPEHGSLGGAVHHDLPLAVRMRPRSLDEIIGQRHLLSPGAPLRRLVEDGAATSIFLWGPPGVGKTTIASIISQQSQRQFVEISAVTSGVKQVREEIEKARQRLAHGQGSVLFIDEVHRFNKAQQDVLLPAVENRLVTLIAATTENPSFSIISPLLSRSLVVTLQPLSDDDIGEVIKRALIDERGLKDAYQLDPEALADIIALAQGDARRALTYLEEAARSSLFRGSTTIDRDTLRLSVDKAAIRYDAQGDQHYDVASAFIKSIRGSDVDAALHYLARMIEGGEDPRFIARRLIIVASEDIGMAAPHVLNTCVAAAQAVALIGMPEGRLSLAHATIAAATAPKSNAVITAIDAAQSDVRSGQIGHVPPHLRDAHYSSAHDYGHGVGYRYAHDYPYGVAAQQYLPDPLVGKRYYEPTHHGYEAEIATRLETIRSLLDGHREKN